MDFRYLIELFAAFIGILSLVLGLSIFFHTRKKEVRYFAITIIFSGLWVLAVYFADITTSLEALVFWTKVASIAALLYVLSFVVFAFVFRHPQLGFKRYFWFTLPI